MTGNTGKISMSVDRAVGEIAKGSVTKTDLPTPALLVDLDLLEANIATMADHCHRSGCQIRPHAKTHKCPEIARRQIEAGARGISTATVAEAEAMVAAGIRGVLLTSPIADPGKVGRMVELARSGGEVLLAVGHSFQIGLLAEAAQAARVKIDVLVDLDVGDHRFGISPGPPALDLAREIGRHPSLRIRGVQAYLGLAAHVSGFEARRRTSLEAMGRAVETLELLNRSGFDAAFLSGGSTGTYNIDSGLPVEVELQSGSYVFMDGEYRAIGGQDGGSAYNDFQRSLTVLTTVVSAPHPGRVSVDAGVKSFATETEFRPEAKDRPGLVYEFSGDEFGRLTTDPGGELPAIGERLEFYVPHCDPTVNLFDRLYAVRGEVIEHVWEITARQSWRS
jgi:D-serine deaminase-like pyridoxal phosphate-dependent protein